MVPVKLFTILSLLNTVAQCAEFGSSIDYSKLPLEDFKHIGEYGQNPDFPVTLTCNEVLFSKCQAQYSQNAGFVGPFSSPTALANAITNKIRSQGKTGLLQLCNAGTLFTQCMGAQMASVCLNPLSLIKNGAAVNDAFGFSVIYYQLHFGCGPGLLTFLYNFGCITSTIIQRNATIAQCGVTLQNQIAKNPSQYCQYAQQYLQCIANVYNAPQCNSAAGWFECAFSQIQVAIAAPLCPLRCVVQQSSVIAVLDEEKSEKLEDRSGEQREPEHQDFDGAALHQGIMNYLGSSFSHLEQLAKLAPAEEEENVAAKKD